MQSYQKLAEKLVTIMDSLGAVEKKGFNKHQNYKYMREVDVMEALKSELIKNKIIMLTSSKFVDIQKKEGKDKTDFITTVETQHTFIDSESGEALSISSVGSGYDSSDKGAAKAITSAVKYAIMKTFMISDEGSDIENDGETIQPPAKATPLKIGKQKTTIVAKPTSEEVVNNSSETNDDVDDVTEKQTTKKVSLNVGRRPATSKINLQPNKTEPNF